MYRFLVVIEKANSNYSAYSPDLPGCVATGAWSETEQNMYQAIGMHLKGLREDGLPVPNLLPLQSIGDAIGSNFFSSKEYLAIQRERE